jgi:hypothetical protein
VVFTSSAIAPEANAAAARTQMTLNIRFMGCLKPR